MATDIIARGMIVDYVAGTNINFNKNEDGSVIISASGEVSSEDMVAREAIDGHKSDKNNPHGVTAEQIGLGNVNNTADVNKPISNATQEALDNKANVGHTHNKSEIIDFPNAMSANGGNSETVNGHTVESDVPVDAKFTDTTNSDITASGNPVVMDGLQGGVPFSEITVSGDNISENEITLSVCGKNLLGSTCETKSLNGIDFTVNADRSITLNGTSTVGTAYAIGSAKLTQGKKYRMSMAESPNGFNMHIGSDIRNQYDYTTASKTIIAQSDNNVVWLWIPNGITIDNVTIYPQIEIGDIATVYEPYHGSTVKITPNSNPYTVPDNIRQQDGYNVITASDGALSVTGCKDNAAVKRIWDSVGMDLLFDGVTSADAPAVIDMLKYDMILITYVSNLGTGSEFADQLYLCTADIKEDYVKYVISLGNSSSYVINARINNVYADRGYNIKIYGCKIINKE